LNKHRRAKIWQCPADPDAGWETYPNALLPAEHSMSFSTWRRRTGPVPGAAMTPFRSAIASVTGMILPMTEASLHR
jgi:hypothetical protein